MEIKGKLEVKGYMTIQDLDMGDEFCFLTEDRPMMLGSDGRGCDFIIDLCDGHVTEVDGYDERPIRRIKATVYVED
jgi:hypothetical protein